MRALGEGDNAILTTMSGHIALHTISVFHLLHRCMRCLAQVGYLLGSSYVLFRSLSQEKK